MSDIQKNLEVVQQSTCPNFGAKQSVVDTF